MKKFCYDPLHMNILEGNRRLHIRETFTTDPLTHELNLVSQLGVRFDTNTEPMLVYLNMTNAMTLYRNYFDRGCFPLIEYTKNVLNPLSSFSTYIPEYNTIFMTHDRRDEKLRLLTHAYYMEQHPTLLRLPTVIDADMDLLSTDRYQQAKLQQELEAHLEQLIVQRAIVEGVSAWIVDTFHMKREVDVRPSTYRVYRAPVDSRFLTSDIHDTRNTLLYQQKLEHITGLKENIFSATAFIGEGNELAKGFVRKSVGEIQMGKYDDSLGLLGYQFVQYVVYDQKQRGIPVERSIPAILGTSSIIFKELEQPSIFMER